VFSVFVSCSWRALIFYSAPYVTLTHVQTRRKRGESGEKCRSGGAFVVHRFNFSCSLLSSAFYCLRFFFFLCIFIFIIFCLPLKINTLKKIWTHKVKLATFFKIWEFKLMCTMCFFFTFYSHLITLKEHSLFINTYIFF